ncbi:gamma subclass chorismate mutase AroQ [Streptomyces sp. NBC_00264]|uniref:gamma subclass chorismate mutase AroQ n=1 Tax=unclassified Streptomyces TaxID=2593676 RepID=UPI0022507FDA|nr:MULTISPECIES: gamma subclass chorismate mutase AroQ [unclassified Streptomyces]MCX5164940.1 gamma subclass chorismate mutase AroQ [Streptomyces sp. NBC_00305]MCX5223464.1 gamma subclass chorismate mutase AroQ [Streptomyces sp. NBC_00264]
MRRPSSSRRSMTAALAAALLAGVGAAAPPAMAAALPGETAQGSPLRSVAELSARRLATGDLVAAAKWGTGGPVDDPARERRVLDSAAERAGALGADPWLTRLVFRDQIEANKAVQRGLHRLWRDHPSEAPAERPRLDDVRKEVDRLNEALVRAVADSAPYRRAAPLCRVALAVSAGRVSRARSLDELHSTALAGSLKEVCGNRRQHAG